MVKFVKTDIAKEKFYAPKKPIKIWDVNVDNIVISKFVKTKTNSKYLIGYLDKDVRPLVLIMPKMIGYVKTFKVEDKNNKLTCFHLMRLRLKILKNIELNALPVYDSRYVKTKIRTNSDRVYTNFRGLNVAEDNIGCDSFTVISINSILAYDKKYLQVHL